MQSATGHLEWTQSRWYKPNVFFFTGTNLGDCAIKLLSIHVSFFWGATSRNRFRRCSAVLQAKLEALEKLRKLQVRSDELRLLRTVSRRCGRWTTGSTMAMM